MMEEEKKKRIPFIPCVIATSLGVGFFPWGPGTMGALLGLGVWYLLMTTYSFTLALVCTIALILVFTALGIWSSTIAERYWGPDPSKVVIDETVGQWIALVPLCFFNNLDYTIHTTDFWIFTISAFVLFRFFDIVKPWGIRMMERLDEGYGIMLDDILAGLYSSLIVGIGMVIYLRFIYEYAIS